MKNIRLITLLALILSAGLVGCSPRTEISKRKIIKAEEACKDSKLVKMRLYDLFDDIEVMCEDGEWRTVEDN